MSANDRQRNKVPFGTLGVGDAFWYHLPYSREAVIHARKIRLDLASGHNCEEIGLWGHTRFVPDDHECEVDAK